MLLIVYVAFTYGLMMPMCFPIAAFSLFNIYVVDTFMMSYFIGMPPTYDEQLYVKALDILQYAPIPMFVLGYWAITNPQVFEGTKYPYKYEGKFTMVNQEKSIR